jgi:hypothetical protein
MRLVFVEAPAFAFRRAHYLDDEEFRRLQLTLLLEPGVGTVIPGTGGFRKMRWHDPRRGKGKRSGLRIVYYWLPIERRLWLFTIYAKNEVVDLTARERRLLKQAIEAELRERR